MAPKATPVTAADRQRMVRQAAALAEGETDDEGTAEQRAARIAEIDAWRAEHHIDPLATEPELHRLARDRGLLRRLP